MASRLFQTTRSQSKGFIHLSLLALLPFLISLMVLLAALSLSLSRISQSQHLCRQQLLDLQFELKQLTEELVALNPQAQQLREARKIARQALRLAIKSAQPKAIAAASAAYSAVQAQETQLHLQQQQILLQARLLRWRRLRGVITQLGQVQGVQSVRQDLRVLPGLALKPHPAGDRIPDYRPASGFPRQQSATLRWSVNLQKIYPSWIQQWLKTHSPAWVTQHRCSATIYPEKETWRVGLIHIK